MDVKINPSLPLTLNSREKPEYLEVYIKQCFRQRTERNTISHSYTFTIKQGRAGELIIGAA